MSYDDFKSGVVIRYEYLRVRDAKRLETDKPRKVAVGVRLARPDGDLLYLFPITKTSPRPDQFAVEIPTMEKRRAGLDIDLRLWIVLGEYNVERIGHSYYLEPMPPLGAFSKAFFLPLTRDFVVRRKALKGVDRAA